MKTGKRIFAAVMSAVLAMSVLSGCGKNENESEGSESSGGTVTSGGGNSGGSGDGSN